MSEQHQADAHDATRPLDQADYDNRPQHTPGPWIVTGSNGYLNQTGIGAQRDRAVIPVGCVYGDPCSEEIKANAHLIAAAPELLTAAQALAALLEAVGRDTHWTAGDETDRVFAWYEFEALRAAIAKAVQP